ncbi:PE-PPE domain-containing protein [Mycolicibacterium sp. HK-90]|uniref:PE-PPE domain-containing protein n=1 Tax=Mycolicibacterium sp. HK-90 TaxID=3056937 RepID=UPI00265B6CFB|nr:PE-PPE domain-containing protein [Mycolicibacterium sp. HK-90]WKG02414.1 PE-PPE domain-containing protein [Mycolicibacterium sp. HK-90]
MISQPTPPRLNKAKAAATAAAVVATTAALTAGLGFSAPEALAAHNRSVQAEVELTADAGQIPDIVGLYGVGPIFWTAQILGITPENVIKAAGGLTGNTALADTVIGLLNLIDAVSPIEAGVKGPMPSDVYDAVNGLTYTTDALAQLLGVRDGSVMDKIIDWLVGNAPILNQRRAIILSESLGGLTTSLAYRDMINAVQSDDPNWGVGVTGQWLIFVNNVSRPGGGLFALATPFTNLFGLNLTTPDAGSYTNPDKTKVLNTSILDITWAYNPLSDAPTTLNPLAWANAAAAGVFLTYLLPDEDNNIGNHVLPKLIAGIADGVKVMVDPTGGQGTSLIPGLGKLLDSLGIKILDFPGTATYITYDSGNLPLLEPFRVAPHLLNLIPGVDIPTPLTDSIEPALRKLVNMGYQDVNPANLERTFGEAGEQAYLWHSPLTPTQQLAAGEIVFDALIDGIQANALNPEAWTPKLPGADFKPIVQNAVTVAAMKAMSDALEAVQDGADPVFDAVEKGLSPVTTALDGVNAQIEAAIDGIMKVNGTAADKRSGKQAITSVPESGSLLKTLSLEAPEAVAEGTQTEDSDAKPTPVKDALKGLGSEKDSFKGKKAKTKARHAADSKDPIKKTVKETVAKVRDAVDDAAKDIKNATEDVQKSKKKAKAQTKEKNEKSADAAA